MDEAQAVFERALEHQGEGRWQEALDLYQALLAARPELNAVRNNLAVCLTELGRGAESLAVLKPLAHLEQVAEIQTSLGNALRSLGLFGQAREAYARVAALAPMDPRAASNLALAHQDLGQMPQAVAGFERAVSLAPNDASLRANLGGALLMAGDFQHGFPAHEFRLIGSMTERAMKEAGLPLWDGQPLNGKRLLVWTEQGLGDSLQFLRFLSQLKAPVTVMAQAALLRLVQGIDTVEAVYGWNDAPPQADLQIPLLSLPRLMGCNSEADIPVSTLTPDPLLEQLWGARLAGLSGLRVGLSWQGNPAMKADAARSAPLSVFQPLFDLPGISWVSLQTGPARAELKGTVLDLGAEIGDLADTAAIMAHLDLVIAVDSAVAHLAGSLNHKVWVMVRANPDWRWKPGATSSPWYPTAKLWRQERLGDWEPIISAMAKVLPTFSQAPE
jgi:Tfp pilus assembly protein PilF